MKLRSQFYLSDAPKPAARQAGGWSSRLKPVWVIPRAWCATTVLQAKGVPRHKTAAFVRLNLARLAPFVDCGVYACRAGDWVHVWFWENQRIREICQQHEIDLDNILLAPESVCLPKGRDGVTLHQCIEGVEAQLWQNGLLIDSAWWPQPVDAQAWQAWRLAMKSNASNRSATAPWPDKLPDMAGAAAGRGVAASLRLSAPWATNLLGDQWHRNLRTIRLDKTLVFVTGFMLACAAFWSAKWMVLQIDSVRTADKIAALSQRVEPLNQARGRALEDLQWTTQLAKLHRADSIDDALNQLQPVLEQQEAALRDFEYVDGELRLTLVPINTELNIPAVIQQLEAQPGLAAIRLLPDSDMRMLRVSAKIRSQPGTGGTPRASASANSAADSATHSAASVPVRPLGPNEGKRERGE